MTDANHSSPLTPGYPRIGVVLSSGGGRGVYAHTGFLMALESLGLPISAMAGCSAGALVGGMVASGTPLSNWVSTLTTVEKKDFWQPLSLPGFFWRMVGHKGRGISGLSDTQTAQEFCRKNLNAQIFEDCQFPFYALAINLDDGEKIIFSTGELAPRIMASAAIPILYQPVKIDNKYCCDGAVVDFAPTDAICCLQNLDVVIINHVSQSSDGTQSMEQTLSQPWSMLKIIDRLLYRSRPWYLPDERTSSKRVSSQRCPCGCGAIIVVIEPKLPELTWPMTDGGMKILTMARAQTVDLLSPYQTALQIDPRGMLLKQLAEGCESNAQIPVQNKNLDGVL
ncbi:MAG: hypothetical protein GXP17_06090 [Gammaproteobacteria bacterium]|nr:hypothetical protein [Gammaproteobacteria bacterium]